MYKLDPSEAKQGNSEAPVGRWSARLVLFASALIGLSFAGSGALAQTSLKVSYQPAVGSAALFVALEEGFFEDHGLDVELVVGGGNVEIAGVVSGSVDISTPTMVQVLQAIENGLDLTVVAGGNPLDADHSRLVFGPVVVDNDLVIDSPMDFEGKRIGVNALYGFLHILFNQMLINAGADPDTVTFVEIAIPQMPDALRSGSVDGVVPVEPTVSRMLGASIGKYAGSIADGAPSELPLLVHAAQGGWASENPEIVAAFRAALDDASEFAVAYPDQVRAHASAYLQQPIEMLNSVPVPTFETVILPEVAAEWVPMMVGQGLLSGEVDVNELLWQ
ncbi:ABC transporter substrate-binding protein [Pelagibacterium lacus]|uniref:SsuA/THI5-like domain-containing protein n=1 Tax=Pelagibacterium lacus TaxID=2282655 RepID=A0A369W0M6_9HYPH|nr:ABC transporter substrate-binding protein [Pelagibacterium lacus]RDE08216.1 hypothetical protein DVH29_12765 [Pelagibacterium lacus]